MHLHKIHASAQYQKIPILYWMTILGGWQESFWSSSLASLLAIPALSWTITNGGDFQTVNFLAMVLGICSLYLPAFCYRVEHREATAAAAAAEAVPMAQKAP